MSEKAPLLGKRMSTGQSLWFNESMLTGMREEYYDEDRFRDVVADALATFRKASGLEKTSNNLILVDWIIHDYIIHILIYDPFQV